MDLSGKQILLGLGGGIAAYKCLELIRRLRECGATVIPVPTAAALQFVTPMSLQALSGNVVHDNLFSLEQEHGMRHIRLAREADLVVVAPATADLLARLANGLADDLLTTLLLARKGAVLLAPAMNAAMWDHPATQRNVARLQEDGLFFIGPENGALACGEEGAGRMAEPAHLLEEITRLLTPALLAGRRVLITAGPTREALDPVRYLSNRSSGRMGWAVAMAARRLGAEVTLIHGPVSLPSPWSVRCLPVVSAHEMLEAVQQQWQEQTPDLVVMTAAVGDFRPREASADKISRGKEAITLELVPNADILAGLVTRRGQASRPLICGFAAETGQAQERGRAKRARKGCDLMVVNDVLEAGCGFDVPTNRVTLIDNQGNEENWPLLSKEAVGERLMRHLATRLGGV
ncbi:MAG: bifunctional phosphopantothenoylcysteine decarboxylase/phosphopantothenate--cysteine ligase CoaBC [Magnetococcales bacterium]|nr:bifunctional phosphopantothenoylcysteine decarboxylase/phosphopantothenate--cysteine ligase CoaBC [Magnetococcales bacterium]